jgi:uncharacterized protein (DUF983 family)
MTEAPPPWWHAALHCRCPACGRGPLFRGLLTVRDSCAVCGLDLRAHDAGDGAVALVIFPLGAILVGLAFWVEFRFAPPLWVHLVLWPCLTEPATIAQMRPFKAGLVALQYRHRATEMGL